MRVAAGSLSPVRTMPPLRELAPQPMVCASKTVTDAPDFARVRAAERPVKPAPIMATSTRWGKSRAAGFGISMVSSQKVFSLMGIVGAETVQRVGDPKQDICVLAPEKPQG